MDKSQLIEQLTDVWDLCDTSKQANMLRKIITELDYKKKIDLWNGGYCEYHDHMGNDIRPLYAARMSTNNPTGVDKKKDDNVREYLWRKGHVSVFEQCFVSLEVKIPIFIARQMMRHKSLFPNEFSMRYSEPLHEYYIPSPDYVKGDSADNKQGSDGELEDWVIEDFINDLKADAIIDKAKYNKHRSRGIAKETVRLSQPVNAYTKVFITGNLRDWFFFLSKRLKPDAQREIRDLSQAIYSILKDLFPLCCEVFEEHTLYGESFGKTEMKLIELLISQGLAYMEETGYDIDKMIKGNNIELSNRRLKEFKERFGNREFFRYI